MTEKRKVLGRGLDTLLPSRPAAPPHPQAAAPAPAPQAQGEAVRQLPLDQIEPNPYQTRTHMDQTAIEELAASIRSNGVLQPITVRPLPNGHFQLISGHRRWVASRLAQKGAVPAIVRRASDEQVMEMTIIENLQREDLNPIEQALAFERLGKEFGLTQEQIAQRTGKERSSVANFLRLLKLPKEVQGMVEKGDLTFGHARALLALDSPDGMLKLGQRVAALSLSVRQTEQAVANLMHPPEKVEKVRVVDPNVKEAEKMLERALGVRVTINDRKGKGKILLEYASLEDFDRIIEALGNK